jgi:hypothetical protein
MLKKVAKCNEDYQIMSSDKLVTENMLPALPRLCSSYLKDSKQFSGVAGSLCCGTKFVK